LKQKINGPLSTVIIVVVSVVIIGLLYRTFFYEKKLGPEDMRAAMMKHNAAAGQH